MKKTLLFNVVLFLSYFLISDVYAQTLTAKGIKAGFQLANLTGGFEQLNGVEKKFFAGGEVGGFVVYSFNERFGIRPEVNYSMKGGKWEGNSSIQAESEVVEMKLNYLEIPILCQYNLSMNNKTVQPYLLAGPAIGFFLNGTMKHKIDSNETESDIDSKDVDTNFGLVLGLGTTINNMFMLNIKYNLGLNTIIAEKADNDFSMDLKQNAILLSIGALF